MNIGTGRSLWHNEDNDRSIAFPLMGKVRMVIPCEPWKLSISLAGIELSKNWVRATLDRKAFEKHFSFEDLDHVFRLDAGITEGFQQLEALQQLLKKKSLRLGDTLGHPFGFEPPNRAP